MLVNQGLYASLVCYYYIYCMFSLIYRYNEDFFPQKAPPNYSLSHSSIDINDESIYFRVYNRGSDKDAIYVTPGVTDVFYLCFSVIDPDSYEELQNIWFPSIRKKIQEHTALIVIGTKIDLRDDPLVHKNLQIQDKHPLTIYDGFKIAEEIGAIGYIECSALTGENINRVFEEGVKYCNIRKQQKDNPNFKIQDYSILPPKSFTAKSARN